MKNIILTITILFSIIGCSTGSPVTLLENEIPSADLNNTSASILGVYELTIDFDSMNAELIQKRQSAIGESWIVSGRSYFDTQPCRDCFIMSGLGYEDGLIIIEFHVRHPFEKGDPEEPVSGRNRLDLDIFDLSMIVAPKPLSTINYALTDIAIPEYVISGPDGFTNEFSDLLGIEIALPYVLVIDDSASVPPSSTFNKFEMGARADFETKFPVNPGQTLMFDLYLSYGYGFSAVLADRFEPKYFNPEFNRKAAWKVEVFPPGTTHGSTWDDTDNSTEFDVTIHVYDWQTGANVNPNLDELSDIYTSSNVDRVSLEIPGMTNEVKTVAGDEAAPGGTGMPGSPLAYTISIANENLLSAGEYTGLVAVYDERSPLEFSDMRDYLIHTPDAGKSLDEYEIPAYVTYQLFTATIVSHQSSDANLLWAKRAGGSSRDGGVCITTLSDNSTVVTGYFNDTATFGEGEPNETDLTSADSSDIFIARYNPDGTLVWAKRAGGTGGSDRSYAITTLSDDSTVITGTFRETATFGEGESNETTLTCISDERDIFIARYNPDGTLAWAKHAGGYGNDEGDGITTLSDDSTIITGYYRYMATFGEGEPNETTFNAYDSSFYRFFIARYNPDGTLAWAKQAGGSSSQGYAVTKLSDNSIVVTGNFAANITLGGGEPNQTTLIPSGEYEFFIARYNSNGTLVWAKQTESTSRCISRAITTVSDNSTVVTGYFNETITLESGEPNELQLTSAGNHDIFIACYNPNGTLIWAKRAGGIGNCRGHGITVLSDNSLVITGFISETAYFDEGEPSEKTLTSASSEDIFIVRYHPDGTLLWAERAGGTGRCYGQAITTLSDDSTVVTGDFTQTATFGEGDPNETILTSAGLDDMFIARFEP